MKSGPNHGPIPSSIGQSAQGLTTLYVYAFSVSFLVPQSFPEAMSLYVDEIILGFLDLPDQLYFC